ncbi:MAG: hypothetical protein DHS20C14_18000 [Phycisphaeraceae bacterium]|nr:MAG: hypothetical protein DHS20C14_18000 [Phycisphaeraceae bacterium]
MTRRPGHPSGSASALRSRGAWIGLAIMTVVALAADLGSKSIAFATVADTPVKIVRAEVLDAVRPSDLLPDHDAVTAVPHVLEFTLVLNEGAVFGMAAGQRFFFIGFTIVAIGFCLWMFASWTGARDRWAHAAIALVVAGGVGNLYDRLVYACVRDFLHFLPGVKLPFGLAWPGGDRELWPYVSNVADAELIIGIALLMWFSLRAPADAAEETPETKPTDDAGSDA